MADGANHGLYCDADLQPHAARRAAVAVVLGMRNLVLTHHDDGDLDGAAPVAVPAVHDMYFRPIDPATAARFAAVGDVVNRDNAVLTCHLAEDQLGVGPADLLHRQTGHPAVMPVPPPAPAAGPAPAPPPLAKDPPSPANDWAVHEVTREALKVSERQQPGTVAGRIPQHRNPYAGLNSDDSDADDRSVDAVMEEADDAQGRRTPSFSTPYESDDGSEVLMEDGDAGQSSRGLLPSFSPPAQSTARPAAPKPPPLPDGESLNRTTHLRGQSGSHRGLLPMPGAAAAAWPRCRPPHPACRAPAHSGKGSAPEYPPLLTPPPNGRPAFSAGRFRSHDCRARCSDRRSHDGDPERASTGAACAPTTWGGATASV